MRKIFYCIYDMKLIFLFTVISYENKLLSLSLSLSLPKLTIPTELSILTGNDAHYNTIWFLVWITVGKWKKIIFCGLWICTFNMYWILYAFSSNVIGQMSVLQRDLSIFSKDAFVFIYFLIKKTTKWTSLEQGNGMWVF